MLLFTLLEDSEISNSTLELLGLNCYFHALAFTKVFLFFVFLFYFFPENCPYPSPVVKAVQPLWSQQKQEF